MLFPRIATAATIGWLTVAGGAVATAQSTAETVDGNDNRRPAGILADGALTVRIYAARGEWHPEREEGPALNVAAFGEEGGPLVTPGPLLRVSEGTDLIVRVRNTLAERLSLHGFVPRPANDDTVFTVEPGQTREIRFAAGAPGTYHYWADTAGSALNRALVERFDPLSLIRCGVAIMGLAGLQLLLMAGLDAAPFWWLWGSVCSFMFTIAIVMPNATVLALDPLPRIAGVASSIIGTLQNLFGAAGALMGAAIYDGSVRYAVITIGVVATAVAAVFLLRRRIAPGLLVHQRVDVRP